jgi:hypothetical protein
MIICDDHFLNDESMLITMLRVFEKRITQTFRLKSISWVISSFSLRREARDVCVCVCVNVWICLCVRRKIRIKSVVCEKDFSFFEFKDFCLLRSILELIARSFVNIKRRKRSLLREQDSESSKLHLRFVTNYKSSFYLLYSFKSQIILSYFSFLCCFSF